MNRIKDFFLRFIPQHISNKVVISFFEFLRFFRRIHRKAYTYNLHVNEGAYCDHIGDISSKHGYIENQKLYPDMVYGKTTISYAGCEIIAAYNALRDLGGVDIKEFPSIISFFEKDGIVLGGKFGTAPKAIRDFLEKRGYKTSFITDDKKVDEVSEKSDTIILTIYNDRNDLSKQIHTICVSKVFDGFIAHNVYGNGNVVGPYKTVSELISQINEGRSKMISLISAVRL